MVFHQPSCILWTALLLAALSLQNAFILPKERVSSRSQPLQMNSLVSVMRKGKQKHVETIYQEVKAQREDHIISKFLMNRERPYGVGEPKDFYAMNYKNSKYSNSLTVLPEFNRKIKNGFILGVPPPEIMGGVLRDSGAKSIIVSLDSRQGGCTIEDFERFTIEQTRARIFLPGPIPIIYHDLVIDPIQIEQAAALGGSAITLTAELLLSTDSNGDDLLGDMVRYAQELEIEPIVIIKNEVEGQAALAAGASCLCLANLDEKELIALRKKLPSRKERPEILYIARLRSISSFSAYHEIDLSWTLRDHDFNCIWPSPESIYSTGMADIYSYIAAMRAKSGKDYMSPRQFLMERKKEGATEFLGDIYY